MPILHRVERLPGTNSPDLLFFCPGCQCGHGVWTTVSNAHTGATWGWNGSMEKPDFRCHTIVTDGKIHFCADCSHGLAGQVVDMVDF